MVAFYLTCSQPHNLNVEPMSQADATTLLASKLVANYSPDDLCLFDRQRIPEALLEEEYTEDLVLSQPPKNVTWWKRRKNRLRESRKLYLENRKIDCNLDDDRLTLMNLSLVKTREGGRSFTMHRSYNSRRRDAQD
jgi:hypothetical protein